MRRRLYEEEYDGYFTDDRDEDEKKIRDVWRCFHELNELFNGYLVQIDNNDEFCFHSNRSDVDVFMKLGRNYRIEFSEMSLESNRIGAPIDGALLGDLLRDIYDAIKKNGSKIVKILKYMDDNGLDFYPIFEDYYQKEFNLKFD